jgi:hypothetical protein
MLAGMRLVENGIKYGQQSRLLGRAQESQVKRLDHKLWAVGFYCQQEVVWFGSFPAMMVSGSSHFGGWLYVPADRQGIPSANRRVSLFT